jgi:D-ribose pyranose/furanose isomerase RbsD
MQVLKYISTAMSLQEIVLATENKQREQSNFKKEQ